MTLSLAREMEPEATPQAMARAVDAGLVYSGSEVVDKETGEYLGWEAEDPTAARFVRQVEEEEEATEAKEALDMIVSRAKLSPAERLVLQGMRQGLKGEELAEWAQAQEGGPSKKSVPVLASKIRVKLKKAAKI